ncbi:MAG: NAD(P)/FAD-dependent oxidoreductase [Usitatibacter sp.]
MAVVGGGLVGSAIGWGLASAGRTVAILDEGDVAHRASRGNFALVWVQGKGSGMPGYAAWTQRSAEEWTAFADMLLVQTGIDVAYRRPGGFHVALSEAELEHRARFLAGLDAQAGVERQDCEILDHGSLAARLPGLGPEVAGASYCKLDGHCNSLNLLRALHAGLQEMRGKYLPGHRVERISTGSGEFRISTARGEIRAASIVLAAGLDNARLAPMVGLDAPVRPQRGQVLVTERTAPFLHYPVSTVRQTDEGGVMLGDSQEEAGFDEGVRQPVLSLMAQRAVLTFPRLAGLNVVRAWAALRVMTPDGFPIYDQSREHPGAFIATCHSGVTLAANHALALAPLIAKGALPAERFEMFSARRFDVPKTA